MPRARLLAPTQLEQICRPFIKIDIVAGRRFFRLLEKAVLVRGIENLFPLEMFLTWKQERNWFVMRVNQKQKSIVAYWITVQIDQVRSEERRVGNGCS